MHKRLFKSSVSRCTCERSFTPEVRPNLRRIRHEIEDALLLALIASALALLWTRRRKRLRQLRRERIRQWFHSIRESFSDA